MSKLETGHGKQISAATDVAPGQSGVPRQFAHGGNGSTGLAQPAALPTAPDDRDREAGDSLVMLQLASFEGRAL